MSFFFSKKKAPHTPLPHATRDTHTAGGSNTALPLANGAKEKSGVREQTPTPSFGGANTPSPEQNLAGRGDPEKDMMQYGSRPTMNGVTPPTSIPNANLYPWSQRNLTFTTSQPNPFPRYGAAVNAVSSKEGEVYLMGGLINGQTVKGDLWMIEAGGGNLACYPVGTTSEGPGPRVGHASLLVGNAFIVFGGDTKTEDRDSLDDTLYLLNTSTRQWSRSAPPGARPAGRYGHTLNILGSKIYIFGGQVEGYFFNDLLAFDLNALQNPSNRWEMLIQNTNDGGPPEGRIPPARTNHTVVSWNDKLYLFGGTNGTQWFNDVWSYDPRTNVWSQLDCIGYIPAPREGHSAALVNDVMYIFGGRTEEATDLGDLAAFRITSRRWYTFQNMGPSPSPRSGHSMTAYGKQIVVLAGEPSSTGRDDKELSLVYVLDTNKIRYPNDQQIQQTPTGERVPGNRRPSGEKSAIPQSRGGIMRDGSNGPPDPSKRSMGGSRESVMAVPGPTGRGQDLSMANTPPPGGPGSRLPRVAGAPSGPPPQQQAPPPYQAQGPQPRTNGIISPGPGPRTKTPTRENIGFGPPVDTVRGASLEKEKASPEVSSNVRQRSADRALSPGTNFNGRRTPTQQPPKTMNAAVEEQIPLNDSLSPSPSQQARETSFGGNHESALASAGQPRAMPSQLNEDFVAPSGRNERDLPPALLQRYDELGQQHEGLNQQHEDLVRQHEGLNRQHDNLARQHEGLIKDFEAARSRNAWYASELAMARKVGYQPNDSPNPILDEKAAQSFGDEDKPLIDALLAMKTELADVQASVESRVQVAAQQVAEVEGQRDAAINEAVYARAKLAAHGGILSGTTQSNSLPQDSDETHRAADINRKLAVALHTQHELRSRIDFLNAELQADKKARELAERTAETAHQRVVELEHSHNPGEIEIVRAQLHTTELAARNEAICKNDAYAKARLLEVDKEDLTRQLADTHKNSKNLSITLASLREAMTASSDNVSLAQRKLEEERSLREGLERKLLQLRSEHEERTAELEATTRKLRDTEELADSHANEARTHRQAVLTGLDKLNVRSLDDHKDAMHDERVVILQQQVESANVLVSESKADADHAAEKLRSAEERIAGLETYQQQASRDILTSRKDLQDAAREAQLLQAQHAEARQQLEVQRRDANALLIQHNTLKDLLGERSASAADHRRSRNLDSPSPRLSTPDQNRLRELEHQLDLSRKAHEETRSSFEMRDLEADKAYREYREKIEQLEGDYQSAVSYVKGTEKMLRKMKEELDKYKTNNARLQTELEASRSANLSDHDIPPGWENERITLRREISEMHDSVQNSVREFEAQLQEVREELQQVQAERDLYRQSTEQAEDHLKKNAQKAHADKLNLEQLKSDNSLLESRLAEAEHKVSLLLDQVDTQIYKIRRRSNPHWQPNGAHSTSHIRSASEMSNSHDLVNASNPAAGKSHSRNASATDNFAEPPSNRTSLALDNLASELETLRTHWEGTHQNYRLSSQFDFERTPTKEGGGGELTESLASWRKRLDAEEAERSTGPIGQGAAASVSPGGREKVASPTARSGGI